MPITIHFIILKYLKHNNHYMSLYSNSNQKVYNSKVKYMNYMRNNSNKQGYQSKAKYRQQFIEKDTILNQSILKDSGDIYVDLIQIILSKKEKDVEKYLQKLPNTLLKKQLEKFNNSYNQIKSKIDHILARYNTLQRNIDFFHSIINKMTMKQLLHPSIIQQLHPSIILQTKISNNLVTFLQLIQMTNTSKIYNNLQQYKSQEIKEYVSKGSYKQFKSIIHNYKKSPRNSASNQQVIKENIKLQNIIEEYETKINLLAKQIQRLNHFYKSQHQQRLQALQKCQFYHDQLQKYNKDFKKSQRDFQQIRNRSEMLDGFIQKLKKNLQMRLQQNETLQNKLKNQRQQNNKLSQMIVQLRNKNNSKIENPEDQTKIKQLQKIISINQLQKYQLNDQISKISEWSSIANKRNQELTAINKQLNNQTAWLQSILQQRQNQISNERNTLAILQKEYNSQINQRVQIQKALENKEQQGIFIMNEYEKKLLQMYVLINKK